jgi:hypothetical protein
VPTAPCARMAQSAEPRPSSLKRGGCGTAIPRGACVGQADHGTDTFGSPAVPARDARRDARGAVAPAGTQVPVARIDPTTPAAPAPDVNRSSPTTCGHRPLPADPAFPKCTGRTVASPVRLRITTRRRRMPWDRRPRVWSGLRCTLSWPGALAPPSPRARDGRKPFLIQDHGPVPPSSPVQVRRAAVQRRLPNQRTRRPRARGAGSLLGQPSSGRRPSSPRTWGGLLSCQSGSSAIPSPPRTWGGPFVRGRCRGSPHRRPRARGVGERSAPNATFEGPSSPRTWDGPFVTCAVPPRVMEFCGGRPALTGRECQSDPDGAGCWLAASSGIARYA